MRIIKWVLAVGLALFALYVLGQFIIEPEESDGAVPGYRCDEIGKQKRYTGKVLGIDTKKTLFSAYATMWFCWDTVGKNKGRVISWSWPTTSGSVTGWGSFWGWDWAGLASWGGPKCITRGCTVIRAKRVQRFTECVPSPVGCIRHRTTDVKFRFLAYGNGSSVVW